MAMKIDLSNMSNMKKVELVSKRLDGMVEIIKTCEGDEIHKVFLHLINAAIVEAGYTSEIIDRLYYNTATNTTNVSQATNVVNDTQDTIDTSSEIKGAIPTIQSLCMMAEEYKMDYTKETMALNYDVIKHYTKKNTKVRTTGNITHFTKFHNRSNEERMLIIPFEGSNYQCMNLKGLSGVLPVLPKGFKGAKAIGQLIQTLTDAAYEAKVIEKGNKGYDGQLVVNANGYAVYKTKAETFHGSVNGISFKYNPKTDELYIRTAVLQMHSAPYFKLSTAMSALDGHDDVLSILTEMFNLAHKTAKALWKKYCDKNKVSYVEPVKEETPAIEEPEVTVEPEVETIVEEDAPVVTEEPKTINRLSEEYVGIDEGQCQFACYKCFNKANRSCPAGLCDYDQTEADWIAEFASADEDDDFELDSSNTKSDREAWDDPDYLVYYTPELDPSIQ